VLVLLCFAETDFSITMTLSLTRNRNGCGSRLRATR
jgi:hypothetical protein